MTDETVDRTVGRRDAGGRRGLRLVGEYGLECQVVYYIIWLLDPTRTRVARFNHTRNARRPIL